MWFKQAQLLEFNQSINLSETSLLEKLEPFNFKACLPTMPSSMGFVSPVDADDETKPLVKSIPGYFMLCLQIEEKLLPATVIRHELEKKIKKIEKLEDRKVRQKEKLNLKDELTVTLLPRAFSKYSKVYAFIDVANRTLVLDTTTPNKIKQFVSFLKKAIGDELFITNNHKLSGTMSLWIKDQDYPEMFSIEKSCVLQDPNQQTRVIRCNQQDLFVTSIKSLIKDGCLVKQLALNWQDRVEFILAEDGSLKSIKFEDEIKSQAKEMEPETKEQLFNADFFIMTQTFEQLFADLKQLLATGTEKELPKAEINTHLEPA